MLRTSAWTLICAALFVTHPAPGQATASTGPGFPGTLRSVWGRGGLDLGFEANLGQTDVSVAFVARGAGRTLYLTGDGVTLGPAADRTCDADGFAPGAKANPAGQSSPVASAPSAVRMRFVGARPKPRFEGLRELPGKVHYLLGNDPAGWHTNIPLYAEVIQHEVYPGIDVHYFGRQGRLEYDFVVAAGADVDAIELAFDDAERLHVDADGDLVLQVGDTIVRHRKPVIYQQVDGVRRELAGSYRLRGGRHVAFQLEQPADARLPLVIDPVLVYSSFLGGSGDERSFGVATDAVGNVYLTGGTTSLNFPVASALQPTNGGFRDAYVVKLDPTGSTLLYATYLGGSGTEDDLHGALAVDPSGYAYVTGSTDSSNFPVTAGAFQTIKSGDSDVFVAKLNPTGSTLLYSTLVGGGSTDRGMDIAVDASGRAVVTGMTYSNNYPLKNPAQATSGGDADVFVTRIDATGSSLVSSTYIGGSFYDWGVGLALDASGSAYVTGETGSTNFPTTAGALQPTYAGGADAFVVKLDPTGTILAYATYLGGASCSGADGGTTVAVDAAGDAYVAGFTYACDFPVVNAFQPGKWPDGRNDGFIAKLNPTGTALLVSTYLGGVGGVSDTGFTCFGVDVITGIKLDSGGNVYVTGFTSSCDFPLQNSLQPKIGNDLDGFVARFDPAVSAIYYSTILGGDKLEGENFFEESFTSGAIAVSGAGSAVVTGFTQSSDFPVSGAVQPAFGGGSSDAYVVRIEPGPPPTWSNVGGSTTGSQHPILTMSGSLVPDSELKLDLVHAAPAALADVLISLTSIPKPFIGGTLHAFPVDVVVLMSTNAVGEIHVKDRVPALGSGVELWFQVAIQGTPAGYVTTLTDCERGTVP